MAAPTRTETIDVLFAATWPAKKKDIIDAVFVKRLPFWYWLNAGGHVELKNEGGYYLDIDLEYDVNPTVQEIGRNGTIALTDVNPITQARYDWGTVAGNIGRNREDDAANIGKARIHSLIDVKTKNLKKSMVRMFKTVVMRAEDSRPTGGINSLLDLVDDAPTDSKTVGSLDQADHSWWQNITRAASGAASLYCRHDLQQLTFDVEERDGEADFLMVPKDFYAAYEDDAVEMLQLTNTKMADAGFKNLEYKGLPMVWDSTCPSDRAFMLSSDYLYLRIDPGLNFAMTDWKEAADQPFNYNAQVVTRAQLVCTNRREQATLTGITY